jgi:hypothetical protein
MHRVVRDDSQVIEVVIDFWMRGRILGASGFWFWFWPQLNAVLGDVMCLLLVCCSDWLFRESQVRGKNCGLRQSREALSPQA